MKAEVWYVYMLKCSDNSLYTGVTVNLARRVDEHNNSPLGAKYTKPRRPVILVYQEICENRTMATKRESEIKKMARKDKIELLS